MLIYVYVAYVFKFSMFSFVRLFQTNHVFPSLALTVGVNLLCLPVCRDHKAGSLIIHGRHLIRKQSLWWIVLPFDRTLGVIEHVNIIQKISTKATKNHYLIFIKLSSTSSLSFWKFLLSKINHNPRLVRSLIIESFDWIAISPCRVGYTAKYINESVC